MIFKTLVSIILLTLMYRNLCSACEEKGIEQIIFVSSAAVVAMLPLEQVKAENWSHIMNMGNLNSWQKVFIVIVKERC